MQDKEKEKLLKNEKNLVSQIIVMNQELQEIIKMLETPQKTATVGAVIGQRVQVVYAMMRELNQDKDFHNRFKDYVEELRSEQKKRLQENQNHKKEYEDMNYLG